MHRGVRVDGATVKRLRKLKGLSQLKLAQCAGISERTVRNAEKGHVLESHIANYLAVALEVPVNEIVAERPSASRSRRLRGLIRKVSSSYLQAILNLEMQSMIELAHPEIEWNCYAAPMQIFSGFFEGVDELRSHLAMAAKWWEQFSAHVNDFSVCRNDAEGEMIYFLLTGQFESEVGQPVEVWQTFICRFEEELLISVDQSLGITALNREHKKSSQHR